MDTSTGAAARSGGRAAGRRDPAFAPDFYRRACAACALLLLALCAATAVGLCDAISGAPKPAARTGPARPPRRLRAVVGADDRQRIVDPAVPPYSSIVQLSMATAAGNASCSGVLLSRDLVLTAASCVYLPLGSVRGITKPSWVYGIRVTPMEKRRAAKPIGVASLHVPTRYFSAVSSVGNTNDAAEADFALLRLSQAVIPTPPLLNRSGTLPYAGGGIALGFPSNKPGLWSSRCQIRISGTNLTQWISCDVGDGQEGGPILRDRLPAVAGSTPPLLVGVAARTPAGSPLNRMTVLGADAESFIRKVLLLPADPCMSGGRTCNTNALCTTNGTRALCACRPGLFGDGYTCASDLCLARGLKCGANGYCLDTGDIPRCRCNAGFIGDGVTCVLPTSTKTATRTRTKTPTRTATRTASRTATRTKAATSTSSRPASTRAASSTATSAMIFVASSSTIQAIDAASTTSRLLANTLPGSSTNGVSSTLTGTTTSLIDVTSTSTASATTTSVFPNPCTNPDILASLPAESEFTLSYVLASANRQYCLKLQNNANLVLFTAAGNVLFSSATGGSLGTSLHLRSDGNLMLRASTGAVIWQTRKWNATAGPYNLVLGGDGKLEIKGKNGYILWSRADGGFLTPSALPSALRDNLALWLDGGNPNSMPGDAPTRWLDTSGNSRDVIQRDSSYAPQQVPGGFDFANGGYFSGAAPLPAGTKNFTMAVVFNASTVSTIQTFLSEGRGDFGATGTAANFYLVKQNLELDFVYVSQTFSTTNVSASKLGFGIIVTAAGSGENSIGSLNGGPGEIGNFPDGTLQINDTCFAVGRVCPTRSNKNQFTGTMHEVMVLSTNLPESLRTWIDGYFAWKWGVVDLLPATHLYAMAPPVGDAASAQVSTTSTMSQESTVTQSTTTTTPRPTSTPRSCDSPDVIGNLTANSTLNLPSVLASPNGQFCLTLQDDANLVLFNATGSVLFSSETTLSAASSLHLRWDGNLMLRASTGSVIWQTRKWNSSAMPYALVLGNDGSLQVTGKNGYVLWSRAEGGYITPPSLPRSLQDDMALWLDGGNPSSVPDAMPMRWLDSSGNSRHVTQWDSSYAPEKLPGGFNFANGGYFTGSAPLRAETKNFTMAVVFNASTVSTYQTLLSQGRADSAVFGTAASFYLVRKNLVLDFMYGSQWFMTTNASAGKLSFGVIGASAGSAGSTASLNGGTAETGKYPDGTLRINDTCFAIGRICPTRLNTNLFTGTMHEVMVFSADLSESARAWIDGYFAWKWGVVDLLPVNHLYAATPPSVDAAPPTATRTLTTTSISTESTSTSTASTSATSSRTRSKSLTSSTLSSTTTSQSSDTTSVSATSSSTSVTLSSSTTTETTRTSSTSTESTSTSLSRSSTTTSESSETSSTSSDTSSTSLSSSTTSQTSDTSATLTDTSSTSLSSSTTSQSSDTSTTLSESSLTTSPTMTNTEPAETSSMSVETSSTSVSSSSSSSTESTETSNTSTETLSTSVTQSSTTSTWSQTSNTSTETMSTTSSLSSTTTSQSAETSTLLATTSSTSITVTTSTTTSTSNPCATPNLVTSLTANASMAISSVLASSSRQFCLIVQSDANLVLSSSSGTVLFSSATAGSIVTSLYLRSDGNLMLRASTGAIIWQTRKWNSTATPYNLVLADDGTLQVTGKNGYVLWSRSEGGYMTPSSLPAAIQANLALWLDGGNPSSMPGGSPLRWLDTSGNSRDAIQSDPSYMPQQLSGGFNFVNGAYFSGSAPLPAMAKNFTMAVVFNASVVSTYQTFVSEGRGDFGVMGTSASFYLVKQNLVLDFMYASQTFSTTNVSASKLSFGVIVTAAGSGKNSIGSLNGGTGEVGNYPDGTLKVNDTCFAIGRLCPTRLNNNLFTGTMHEVMMFTTNLPDSLRFWIDGYFAWKWGVVDSLPSTHLYAATPPVADATPGGTLGSTTTTQSTATRSTSTTTTRTTILPTSCGTPNVIANLTANSTLDLRNTLASSNRQYCLTLQDDANLILSNTTGSVLFSSDTALASVSSLFLRWDGNLILRASTGAVVWQTRKWNSSATPYTLVLGDDGSLQVVGKNGYLLWSRSDGGYKTPSSLPSALADNLALWLDGGNPSSMPSGTPMRWLDTSGNSRHVSQWDTGYMPLRLPGGFNFANNGYFTGSAPLPFKALNFTYAVVFNASTVSTYQTFLSQGRADTAVTGTAASFYLVKQNLVEDFMYASQTFTTTNVSASKLSFGVIVTAAGSGKNSIGSLNGGTGETGNYPDGTLKVDTTCFALGRLCPTRLNNNLFTGTMHEVMVFSTNLPDSLRYWVDGYFAWKWGVVDNLPATHLYFGTPPV